MGAPLASLLAQAGARIVAISTTEGAIYNPHGLDVGRLRELATNAGKAVVDRYPDAERIDRAALLELQVDILCPCARHNSIHEGNAPRLTARLVCPGANNPVTPGAERILFERGILCLPDFVTNCGGVLGGTMEFACLDATRIAAFIERHIGPRIGWILDEAKRQSLPPRLIAEPLALRRFAEMQSSADHPTPLARLFQAALELYRRGMISGPFVATLSLSYFARRLA